MGGEFILRDNRSKFQTLVLPRQPKVLPDSQEAVDVQVGRAVLSFALINVELEDAAKKGAEEKPAANVAEVAKKTEGEASAKKAEEDAGVAVAANAAEDRAAAKEAEEEEDAAAAAVAKAAEEDAAAA